MNPSQAPAPASPVTNILRRTNRVVPDGTHNPRPRRLVRSHSMIVQVDPREFRRMPNANDFSCVIL